MDFDEDIILVEGTFDALNAGDGAVPLLGSTLRENSKLFQEIVKNDSTVYIALDQDAEKKARRLIRSLLEYDIEVYKVNLDGYADVGEMPKDEFNKRKLKSNSNGEDLNKARNIYQNSDNKKIPRNAICPLCDSGKKYKRCCGKL